MKQVRDQLQQVNTNVRDQQQVNVDIRDQLQQISMEVRDQQQVNVDQFQQLNQRLDYLTTLLSVRISVESYSPSGQTISPSHFPNVPELQVASGSERMVAVPIHQEQSQSEGAEETSGEHLEGNHQDPSTYIWKVILSFKETFNDLLEFLRVQLGVSVASISKGSLLITVTCSSLQILEGLWKNYCSGHLNEVVQQKLVTPDVLERLQLSDLKLKTTITEEEYKKCKEFFLPADQVRPD
ncbi:hypothetical protein OS493_010439 [Desmophyllum pertusum]|uniref:TRADD-like N-terminal domain-containing protein n=1 Tax=Desmophyllum pertusum TaxID=174260 RepID=A0A9X0A3I8_9CNID|nr:hypothetical protein OS493_010439 [Desmophyllum pertusum]